MLASAVGVFLAGYAIVQLDTVIPVIFGRGWRRKDAWKRYTFGVSVVSVSTSVLLWLASHLQSLADFLPNGSELPILLVTVVIGSYLGVLFGVLRLAEAPDVISAIIDAMFPPGGSIMLGARDIDAPSRVLSFLEKVGGPYRDLLFVVANGINSPITSWYVLSVFTSFTDLSEDEQHLFILRWFRDENLVFRSLAHAFKALGSLGYYTDPRIWKEIGFPGPFVPELPQIAAHTHEVPNHTHIEGPPAHRMPKRMKVVEDDPDAKIFGVSRFEERSRRYRVLKSDVRVRADVCIVGSGAGGATLARELARNPAVKRVVLLERGSYYEGEDFNQRELDMISALWKGGALTFNQDFSIFIGQGETLGGTTVINHAICIDTPRVVLEEWARMGVSDWITDATTLQKTFDGIKEEIVIKPVDERQINRNNMILKQGAEALNIPAAGQGPNPRNDFDCCECGFSHLGCHYNTKQSTLVTYVPQALDTDNCAVFCDCFADRITFNHGVATGVDAVFMTKAGEEVCRIRVDANLVIVAAGAINSTALLLRSKLRDPYKQIGRGLSIHPSPLVVAEFPDEVRAYRGIPMSYHVSEYSVLNGVPGILDTDPPVTSDLPQDQRGGFMLESVFPNPGQFGAFIPGVAEEHKEMMKMFSYYAAAGILIRDTPKGVVSTNPSGEPVIQYGLGPHDRRNLSNGIRKLSEIFFKAGAIRVIITHRAGTTITREEYQRDPNVLKERVRPENCGQEELYMGAVHPQGGNRMGESPRDSVVDSHCRSHHVKNLFVCDASVFPTATGVNPMLTIIGIAKRTAEYINSNWEEIRSTGKVSVETSKPWVST